MLSVTNSKLKETVTKLGFEDVRIDCAIGILNTKLLAYAGEIKTPVLLVHGEKAHSRYFSEGAFQKLKGDNKVLLIVPGANHTDLYDNLEKIPFNKIAEFYTQNLK